jgi:hypothetical protein
VFWEKKKKKKDKEKEKQNKTKKRIVNFLFPIIIFSLPLPLSPLIIPIATKLHSRKPTQ